MATEKRKKTTPARTRRTRKPAPKQMSLSDIFKRRKKDLDFKPDPTTATWVKTTKLTRQQQLQLTKWSLYILTVILCLVIQDAILSQFSLLGATTDLAVCAILLITVIEGTEVGSLFVLIASTLYYFSGSAPGAYCIGLMTYFGVGTTLFRQMFWHRSKGSIILCAGIALVLYEMGLFLVGLYNGLTIFSRIGSFVMTSVYCCILLIPLYSLIYKIGLIGGNTWKE